MKKILVTFIGVLLTITSIAQERDTLSINEITVVSFYRNDIDSGSVMEKDVLISNNYGQEPSHMFAEMPSIISLSDNGTEFGYGYYRIRGLDQTRVNVTLDGCPWNEAEDFGSYFANSPDLMSSMKSIKVERGGSSSNNGIAGSAGGINMESIDIFDWRSRSYVHLGAGNYNTYKATAVYNMMPRNGYGLHIKATHQQTDGYRNYGFNNSQALTVKTGRKFNDRHTLDFLTMNGFHRNGQGWIGVSMDELVENPRANGNPKSDDDNWFMSMNRLQYKGRVADNIILTSSAYGQFQTGAYRMALDSYMSKFVDSNWGNTGIVYDYHLNHYMVGGNVFAKFYLRNFIVTTGINTYSYKRTHEMGNKCVEVPREEFYSNYGNKDEISGLLNLTYKPNDKFTIGGNVQYRSVAFHYKDTEKYGNPYGEPKQFDKTWDFTNAGANIEYSPSKYTKLYARYTLLNREPTRSDMFGGNEYYYGELVTTTPEISRDLEVGFDVSDDVITLNFNLFHMWFNNELILNGEYGPNGLPCHENALSSFRRGVEMSMEWNVASKLYYTLNGSISQNKVESASFGDKTHVLSPSQTAFTELAWKDYNWELGVSYSYRGKMYVDMANEYELPSAMSLDAYIKLKFYDFEICTRFDGIGPMDNKNFCTGMVGANGQMLYIQNSPFNLMCTLKYFF